MKNLPNNTN